MKNIITKGLTKSFEISIVIKNNIAQILIASAIFVLCCGIAVSFILGMSTITVKSSESKHPNLLETSTTGMPIFLSHQTLFEPKTNKLTNIMEIEDDKK